MVGALAALPGLAFAQANAHKSLDILILGGTGFIGPHEINYARARGHKVTMFNRGKTAPDMFPDVEALIGDRDDQLDIAERSGLGCGHRQLRLLPASCTPVCRVAAWARGSVHVRFQYLCLCG